MSSTIIMNLAEIHHRIDEAAARSGRASSDISLCSVSKTVDLDKIREAYNAGETCFGENYVQEAISKIPQLPDDVQWHFIGHLQTNKVKLVVGRFNLIQSVDSLRLATAISDRAILLGQKQAVLIEINLDPASAKTGIPANDFPALYDAILDLPGIEILGLMGMPPTGNEGIVRPCFVRLRNLFQSLLPANKRVLSMGMSGDFEMAIEEGSTMVRIGSAIFGSRPRTP